MLWILGFIVLMVALAIPILSIVLDSPAVRRLAENRGGDEKVQARIQSLEDEMQDVQKALVSLREQNDFLHRLLENPENRGRLTEGSGDK